MVLTTPPIAETAATLAFVAEAADDLVAARELAKDDEAFADEVPALEVAVTERAEKLRRLLIPRDPDDGRDVIMEIKGGEGGEESALFAADLWRMYERFFARQGWRIEVMSMSDGPNEKRPQNRLQPCPPGTLRQRSASTRCKPVSTSRPSLA